MKVKIEEYVNFKRVFRPAIAKNAEKILPKELGNFQAPISETQVLELIAGWKEKHKTKTVNNKIFYLRNFFKYCEARGYNVYKHFNEILNIKDVEDNEQTFVTAKEVTEALSKLTGRTEMRVRQRFCTAFLWETGVRVSELLDITIADINKSQRLWKQNNCDNVLSAGIISKKSKRIKYISWTSDLHKNYLIPYLTFRLLKNVPHDYLVVNLKGQKLTSRTLEREIKEIFERIGLKDITPHSLRRGFGLDIYINTKDIHATQRKMGHTSITSTQKYLPLTEQTYFELHKNTMPTRII